MPDTSKKSPAVLGAVKLADMPDAVDSSPFTFFCISWIPPVATACAAKFIAVMLALFSVTGCDTGVNVKPVLLGVTV